MVWAPLMVPILNTTQKLISYFLEKCHVTPCNLNILNHRHDTLKSHTVVLRIISKIRYFARHLIFSITLNQKPTDTSKRRPTEILTSKTSSGHITFCHYFFSYLLQWAPALQCQVSTTLRPCLIMCVSLTPYHLTNHLSWLVIPSTSPASSASPTAPTSPTYSLPSFPHCCVICIWNGAVYLRTRIYSI